LKKTIFQNLKVKSYSQYNLEIKRKALVMI